MQIHELTPDATAAWNEFVFSATNGTFFHRVEWVEVLQRAFGFTNHYLFAEEGGKVIGVLPLVLVRSVLFGSTLASTPYCVYGGALAADPDTAAQLEARVARLAEHMGVDYLELRSTALTRPDWLLSDLYVTFRKTLSRDGGGKHEGHSAQAARDGAQGHKGRAVRRSRGRFGSLLPSLRYQHPESRHAGVSSEVLQTL